MIPRDAIILLDAISDSGYHPTKWEEGFLRGIRGQADMGVHLQEKQSSKLQEIYRQAYERI